MEININFTIEYENPKNKSDYENNMSIPCTKKDTMESNI